MPPLSDATGHGLPRTCGARRGLGFGLAVVLGLGVGVASPPSALAVLATVSPSVTAGISNTETQGQSQPAATSGTPALSGNEAFAGVNVAAQLQLTEARSVHRAGYGYRLIHYFGTRTDQSHSALWLSEFTLGPRATLQVGADGSIYGFGSPIAATPATATVGSTLPVDTTVVTGDATQGLTYQPSGSEHYAESLLVGYVRPLHTGGSVPESLRVSASLRGEHIAGITAYSLAFSAEEFRILSQAPLLLVPGQVTPPTDQAVTLEALLGWRRELSLTTNVSLEAGAMAIFGVGDQVAVAPALIASGNYRWLPWYTTLSLSQQPLVNPYLGQVLIADVASLRLLLPLDAQESWVAVALGGYTYTRLISPTHDVFLSDKAYSLVQLGLSLAYRFRRVPFFASLDYTDTDQSGATTAAGIFPSSHRRLLSVNFGGNFAWGEGNHGLARPEGPLRPSGSSQKGPAAGQP
jgi:hypothetical protein